MPYTNNARVRGRMDNLRSMLREAGVGDGNAAMAIQFAFELPRTGDPYAPGILVLVQALQQALVRKGYDVGVDGGLGGKTARALERVAGKRWRDKTWTQLLADVLTAPDADKGDDAMYQLEGLGAAVADGRAGSTMGPRGRRYARGVGGPPKCPPGQARMTVPSGRGVAYKCVPVVQPPIPLSIEPLSGLAELCASPLLWLGVGVGAYWYMTRKPRKARAA